MTEKDWQIRLSFHQKVVYKGMPMNWKAIAVFVASAHLAASGQVTVSFFGLDRAHLNFSGYASHTNSQSLQFIRKDGQQVTVIATSTSGMISGTAQQSGITQQGAKFAVRENFIVDGHPESQDSGEISLARTNSVGGTMLYSESIPFTAADTNTIIGTLSPYSVLIIPEPGRAKNRP